jgi:protein-S-isoprenylcysteine O-methyltransferase Ste14
MSILVRAFLLLVAPPLSITLALLGMETMRANFLGWVLLLIGAGYPAGAVILLWFRKRAFWEALQSGEVASEEKGDLSFWLCLPGFLASFFAPPLEYLHGPAILPRSAWMPAGGLAFLLLGVALRVLSRRRIGGFYSGHVEVLEAHQLAVSGPFRSIRHPGYAGFLLMTLGIAVGYSSVLGLLSIMVLLLPGLVFRMATEDRLLAKHFGDEYEEYARRTKRLIPGVW